MKSYVSTSSPEAPAPWSVPSFPGGNQSYVSVSPPGASVPWPLTPNTGSSNSFPGVTQYFSVATQEEQERVQPVRSTSRTGAVVNGPLTTNNPAQLGTKECSVKVMKCPAENGNTLP